MLYHKKIQQENRYGYHQTQTKRIFHDGRIALTEEGIGAAHEQIITDVRPEEYYIITEYSGGSEDRDLYPAFSEHIAYCHQNQIYSPYSFGGLVRSDTDFSSGEYTYSHLYTKVEPEDITQPVHVTVIPPRTYLSIYSTEGYDSTPTLYAKLLEYTRSNGYTPGEYFFEDVLLDDMSKFGLDEYTIKISLPVET